MTPRKRQSVSTRRANAPRPDARIAFLEFEAMGHLDMEGEPRTQKWFAEKHDVSEESLSRWKGEPDWDERVEALRSKLMKSLDRRIWAKVGKAINTASDATLFSKRFGFMATEPDTPAGGTVNNFHIHGPALIEQQREFFKKSTGVSSVDEVFHDPGRPRTGRPRARKKAQ